MIIIKNNKYYNFDISPKTIIDDNSITIQQGKYKQELNEFEVITLINLLTNLLLEKYDSGRWIKCSDICPPNNTYCLITDYKGDIRIEKHLSGNEWYAGFNYVVAWQPLPKPYEEMKDKEK